MIAPDWGVLLFPEPRLINSLPPLLPLAFLFRFTLRYTRKPKSPLWSGNHGYQTILALRPSVYSDEQKPWPM